MAASIIYTGDRLPMTWSTATTSSDDDGDLALMLKVMREYAAGAWTSLEDVIAETKRARSLRRRNTTAKSARRPATRGRSRKS